MVAVRKPVFSIGRKNVKYLYQTIGKHIFIEIHIVFEASVLCVHRGNLSKIVQKGSRFGY